MNITTAMTFLPGSPPRDLEPLARYLPPLPQGTISAWLAANVAPGERVLDPFGASPMLAVEAARAGYQVLVAANNPVSRFLLEMSANPPSLADLQGALAELGASRMGSERIEKHIQSLYATPCAKCRAEVIADAFIWDGKLGKIIGRTYTCPRCDSCGELPPDPGDEERAARWAAAEGMHRARILERVAPRDDPDREHAEEALSTYLPRTIYALGTIINRLDQFEGMPSGRRNALTALLLTACDQSCVLWPHPTERPRPRQLAVPARFRENNVWKALEEGISIWASAATEALTVTRWPQEPAAAGVCIYEGPLRDIAAQTETPFNAVIGAIPRPNHAFWTLSALWSGWLWGRQAAMPFKPVLRRRRYDWQWHAEALHSAFSSLLKMMSPQSRFFAFLAEAEPSFVTSAMMASSEAGLGLAGLAMRTSGDPLQILWTLPNVSDPPETGAVLRDGLSSYLATRAEATTYLHLHTASTALLTCHHTLPGGDDSINKTAETIQHTLRSQPFAHFDARSSPETGTWGLAAPDPQSIPMCDKVEMSVVRHLQAHPGQTLLSLQAAVNDEFPGLLTPSLGLVGSILNSYAYEENGWHTRPQDAPSERRANIKEMRELLVSIGKRLGFNLDHSTPNLVLWQTAESNPWAFHVTASAVVGKILHTDRHPAAHHVLVLPGSRAGLLSYKLRRDPNLRSKAEGWQFLKFRHLRQIAEMPLLNLESWQEIIRTDPIEQNTAQMMMF